MAKDPQTIIFGKHGLRLSWDEYFWEGPLVLPVWSGFQCRAGVYGSLSSDKPSDGSVTLSVRPPNDRDLATPTGAQEAALDFQLEHAEEIKGLILDRILQEIPNIREYLEEEMPNISTREDLKNHIGLHTVSVHNFRLDDKDDPPYVGYHFGCTWEEEHGLGVMMDGRTIHEFGGEDVCC
jgi:hypothetical protein